MRVSSVMTFGQGVDSILEQYQKQLKTTEQLSSGLRINRPSDDPVGSVRVLELENNLARIDRFGGAVDSAEARLSLEETVLGSIGSSLQRLHELAVNAGNGVLSAQNRQGLGAEVSSLRDQILSQVNSKDNEGQSLFGGMQSQGNAFAADGTYQGTVGSLMIQISDARAIAVADNGRDVFTGIKDSSGTAFNLIGALNDFAADLAVGTNSDMTTHIDRLLEGMASVNQTRLTVGARLSELDVERGNQDSVRLAFEKMLSSVQDLDYAEAISRFQRQQVALESSQKTFMKVAELSLFNYM